MLDALLERIEGRREELVELTRELIRIPTVNPPGDAYKACARHLGNRLQRVGFEVTFLRAEGAIGDSDRYPRTNVIARYEGRGPGCCVHFNGHTDVVTPGQGWTFERTDFVTGPGSRRPVMAFVWFCREGEPVTSPASG